MKVLLVLTLVAVIGGIGCEKKKTTATAATSKPVAELSADCDGSPCM